MEFVAETSAHSLAFLYSREEFDRQVKAQSARIKKLFGKKPTTFMALSPSHWESWRNPLRVLEQADPERFRDLLENEDYMKNSH